ncbi:MAG: helix-turn-helix domain-containing protein [bacterium]|nr:helix-turn-helix domain-containing protein [bacterium]
MWLQSFRSAYLEAIQELLWRQWTTLGVFGQEGYSAPAPIDPEALIIATTWFGRYDPRLYDGAAEWWLKNSEWLSSTRLQRLQMGLMPRERRALAAGMEAVLLQEGPGKWKRLVAKGHEEPTPIDPETFFLLRDGKPLPQVGAPDPTFLRLGFLRPKMEPRRMSESVPLDRYGNLRVRLRAFFGVNSRAEIVLYLLAHESCYARLLARQTHYAYASISAALKQMALSGLVSASRFGKEVEYRIDRPRWQRFFGLSKEVVWTDWALVFKALYDIWECIENLKGRTTTRSVLESELRRCAGRVNMMLRSSELGFALSDDGFGGAREYLTTFSEDVRKLFEAFGVAFDGPLQLEYPT